MYVLLAVIRAEPTAESSFVTSNVNVAVTVNVSLRVAIEINALVNRNGKKIGFSHKKRLFVYVIYLSIFAYHTNVHTAPNEIKYKRKIIKNQCYAIGKEKCKCMHIHI